MDQPYQEIGSYPGVVKDQSSWIEGGIEGVAVHPRMVSFPLVMTFGEDVLVFTDSDGRTPKFLEIDFFCNSFPEEPNSDTSVKLFPDGRYNRPQNYLSYVARSLQPYGRQELMGHMRFMECWQAYSRDLVQAQNRFIGVASLTVAQTMVEVKKLPFHVDYRFNPDRVRVSEELIQRFSLDPENPFQIMPRAVQIKKLEKLADALASSDQNVPAAQRKSARVTHLALLLKRLDSLPTYSNDRRSDAAHTR